MPSVEPLSHARAYALLCLVVLLWGANWPIMKVGLAQITPLWFAVSRFGMGAACVFLYLAATRQLAWPSRADLPVILSVGLFQMAFFQPLVGFGIQQVPAGRAAVLVYTTPIWVVPGAMLFLGERLTGRKIAGVALGLAGIAVLFNPLAIDWSQAGAVLGSLGLMVAAMIWGVALLHIRGHRWRLSPLQLTAWQLLLAFGLLLPLALAVDRDAKIAWDMTLYLVLGYNGVIATAFGFFAATSITRALPAITSSLSFLAVPAMGMLLAGLSLGERPDASLLGGFALILAGVVLVTLAEREVRIPAESGHRR